MTDYAGEDFLITHIALGFRKEPLGPHDVHSVKAIIFTAGEAVNGAGGEDMTWDPEPVWTITVDSEDITGQGWWQLPWNTAGKPSGSYKAKVLITGLDDGVSWEYKKIRLARDPQPTS